MIAVFLQVRIDSLRLPEKALLHLVDQTVIEHAMESLRRVEADLHVMLTDHKSSGILEPYAEAHGFEVFAGEAEDVLKRYTDAARSYGVDTIIRATGDNPLVSWQLTNDIIWEHKKADADYSGYLGPPYGTQVEVLRAEALFKAERETDSDYDHEHVAPYIYNNPETFRLNRLYPDKKYICPDARVTVDTWEDYHFLSRIYAELYRGYPIPILRLIEWLNAYQKTPEQFAELSV